MADERPIALVTGASRGIGAACARDLADAGFLVLVNYRSSTAEAEALAKEIDGRPLPGDVTDTDACEEMIRAIKDDHGRLDVLVNNAGFSIDAPLMTMRLDDIDRQRSMGRGTVYLTKLAIRRFFFRQRSGRIINLTSVVAAMGNAGQVPYTMEKAGIEAMTRSLAIELQDRGILVNSVAPGFIETDMTSDLPAAIKEGIVAATPMKRMGRPEEVAEVVRFLATSGSFITGQTLHVNGGLYRT